MESGKQIEKKVAVKARSMWGTPSLGDFELVRDEKERVPKLVEHKEMLEKALQEALEENKRLLHEAKRRQGLERQYEDEKDLQVLLTIIIDAVKASGMQTQQEP